VNVSRKILWLLLAISLVSQSSLLAQQAPDFMLKDVSGKNHSLQEYLEQGPVLISFWATWCVPCKKEMPGLIEIWNEHRDDGLTLVAIAVDTPRTQSKVKSYARSQKWEMPVLLDTSGKMLRQYQGSNPPMTVIVDQTGEIVFKHSGYAPGDEDTIAAAVVALFVPSQPEVDPQPVVPATEVPSAVPEQE
jgi:cytochrome c biogenesis protein CcmG, thiol:disulfide interchange protein DsbE